MQLGMCVAKIHRATVTAAELHYVGSITIDSHLMAVAGIRPYQMVQVTNCANGALWRTYAIPGPAGRGDIGLNGPPARLFAPGDKVIILAEGLFSPQELDDLQPVVVFVDDANRVTWVQRGLQSLLAPAHA